MRRAPPPLPQDGIYRTILWALVLTVVSGALVAIAGDTVYHDPAMSRVGTGAALIGAALYVLFRFLGAREAMRRAEENGPGDA